jgi:hypothetical protein
MNSQAIATHLSIADSAIIEVQEWASVLWVRFTGGVRFVSKKITERRAMITQKELASAVADRLSNKYGFGRLSTWEKAASEVRVYVKKFGYVSITDSISLHKLTSYKTEIAAELAELLKVKVVNKSIKDSYSDHDGLVTAYGAFEVADAIADVAREDWDI